MARRHHRRHRGFRGYISVPSFGGLKEYNPLGKHVSSTDVLVGAGAGLALGAVVKWGLNKLQVAIGGKIPATIMAYAGPLSTFIAGAGLYMLQRKAKKSRAEGHLVGASAVAAGAVAWALLGQYGPKTAEGVPFFSDYVVTNYGLLTQDAPRSMGLLAPDQSYRGYGEGDPFSAP